MNLLFSPWCSANMAIVSYHLPQFHHIFCISNIDLSEVHHKVHLNYLYLYTLFFFLPWNSVHWGNKASPVQQKHHLLYFPKSPLKPAQAPTFYVKAAALSSWKRSPLSFPANSQYTLRSCQRSLFENLIWGLPKP